MCRAHGIAHQRVTQRGELRKALLAAWALNKHSVVEVITQRDSNVGHHRAIQDRVKQAVLRALHTVSPPAGVRTCRTDLVRGTGYLVSSCSILITPKSIHTPCLSLASHSVAHGKQIARDLVVWWLSHEVKLSMSCTIVGVSRPFFQQ